MRTYEHKDKKNLTFRIGTSLSNLPRAKRLIAKFKKEFREELIFEVPLSSTPFTKAFF